MLVLDDSRWDKLAVWNNVVYGGEVRQDDLKLTRGWSSGSTAGRFLREGRWRKH